MYALDMWSVSLEYFHCYKCQAPIVLTADFHKRCFNFGEEFFCPHGHGQVFADNEVERLKKKLANEKCRREMAEVATKNARKREDKAERSLAATKGHLTRKKKRIAAGVCPCCSRTFSQLARHMAGQHPDYVKQAKRA